jgi:hypothetical protein
MPLGAHKAALFGVAGVSTGDVVLLSTQTASDSASLDFTSGIDSTYGEYIFKFYNINPATDGAALNFQVNASGETGYNESAITTFFYARHDEADVAGSNGPSYNTTYDMVGTGAIIISPAPSNASDASTVGELSLYNPSSTTYVKHFIGTNTALISGDMTYQSYVAGYINTTAAIDEIQFSFAAGNFDGTITMWGVKN